MIRLGFFNRLLTNWRIRQFERLLTEHATVKKRFSELVADTNNYDPVHLYRISEYARMLSSYEIQLKEYGYTP